MGAVFGSLGSTGNRKPISAEVVDEIMVHSSFTAAEIKRLWVIFISLDTDGKGHISPEEMGQLPQLQYNPLGKRVVDAVQARIRSEKIVFKEFVKELSVFSPLAPYEAKLRFAFKIFDFDGDGKLGRGDLMNLIHALVPSNQVEEMDDAFAELVVQHALDEADHDFDGSLNFEEFRSTVAHSEIASKLTIAF